MNQGVQLLPNLTYQFRHWNPGIPRYVISYKERVETCVTCVMTQDSFAALPDLLRYQNRWWICGDVALGVANQVGTQEKLEDHPNGCLLRGIYLL